MTKEQRYKILDNCDNIREMLLVFESKIMDIREEIEKTEVKKKIKEQKRRINAKPIKWAGQDCQ